MYILIHIYLYVEQSDNILPRKQPKTKTWLVQMFKPGMFENVS